MNRGQKLEEEKQAVLERIRIRRAEYRMQFLPRERLDKDGRLVDSDTFPRSVAFKLLTHHPFLLLGAAAALFFAGPRKSLIAAATSAALAALQRYGIQHFLHPHS